VVEGEDFLLGQVDHATGAQPGLKVVGQLEGGFAVGRHDQAGASRPLPPSRQKGGRGAAEQPAEHAGLGRALAQGGLHPGHGLEQALAGGRVQQGGEQRLRRAAARTGSLVHNVRNRPARGPT